MEQVLEQKNISEAYASKIYTAKTSENVLTRFYKWTETQEEKRFFWLGVSLFGGIGAILPATLMSIFIFANNNFTYWIIACVVNVPVLTLNLAAQPPRITIPALIFSCVVSVAIIVLSVARFLLH